MRILITNDDGINAPGLKILHDIATEVAGPGGEVWTVAPAFEQSGVAHATSHARPTLIAELGPRRYAAEGSPGDCVLAGIYDVFDGERPDLILSGVNKGNNSAENALYSGTLGAAMEGALQNLPAIALSQYYGPRNVKTDNPFEASAAFGVDVVRKILATDPPHADGYRLFYNVNFPPVPAADVQGIKACPQGLRQGVYHSVEPYTAPSGRRFMWMKGGSQQATSAPGTDSDANLNGYISVTPMRADLTEHSALSALQSAFS